MYSEYLYNNDTQELQSRVRELAQSNEFALRTECKEVSNRVDTSSLDIKTGFAEKTHSIYAVFSNMRTVLRQLSASLAAHTEVFRTRDGQVDFGVVCQAVTAIEEGRVELLSCVADLAKIRQDLFASVADANRALHFLKIAKQSIPEGMRTPYADSIERTEAAYARLTATDVAVREVQTFSMTFVERHLPNLMESLRTAADFNHVGAALDRVSIRTLCTEALIAINRAPNITF